MAVVFFPPLSVLSLLGGVLSGKFPVGMSCAVSLWMIELVACLFGYPGRIVCMVLIRDSNLQVPLRYWGDHIALNYDN